MSNKPGVVTGLCYLASGAGDVMFIEALSFPDDDKKEKLKLTGSLGKIIKESAQISLSWLLSNDTFDTSVKNMLLSHTFHIHFPAGAIPKDGPSAGIAICTALFSLLTRTPCSPQLAMTGELSLTGRVMPVGGIKEKIIAAHRAGVKRVILPAGNHRDIVADVSEEIKRDLEFVYVNEMQEVLSHTFGIDISTRARL